MLLFPAAIILLPLFVVFLSSFTPPRTTQSTLSRNGCSFSNYRDASQRGKFLLAFANSTLVAASVTFFQIITSATSGYAFSWLKFRGGKLLLLTVLSTIIIPFGFLVIPIFLVLKCGNLINIYWALILRIAANGFGIFLLQQYFQTTKYAST